MKDSQDGSKKNKKLAVTFNSLLGTFIVILFTCLLVISIHSVRKNTVRSYEEDCNEILTAHSERIANQIKDYMNNLDVYTKADIVKTGNTTEIKTWLTNHKELRPEVYQNVFYCNSTGKMYTDKGSSRYVSSAEYYKSIVQDRKKTYISNITTSFFTGKPVIFIAKNISTTGTTEKGFFGATLDLSMFQKSIESIKIGKGGYAFLLGSDGCAIYHPKKDLIKDKDFTSLADKKYADMEIAAKKMIQGEKGQTWVTGIFAKKELLTYGPVPGTNWSLAICIPNTQVYETAGILQSIILSSAVIIAVILLLLCTITLHISIKPLQLVQKAIKAISSGNADLTKRIDINSKNEIGSVVSSFNFFITKLQNIIKDIKTSKTELHQIGKQLQDCTSATTTSVTQIISNIENVNSKIKLQSSGVEETASAITQITQNIMSLEKMIENQTSSVLKASSAVEEMLNNINSVDHSVGKMAISFDKLLENAKKGVDKQQDVNKRMEQIKSQSQMLQDANNAIATIAEQTNLLAMNAAIEAAHAGEAGKGFSVVADEIRKLSDTSSAQSKTIGEDLRDIETSITEVFSASVESGTAFTEVSKEITETNAIVQLIKNNIEKQQHESNQITEALQSMDDNTEEVRTASKEMSVGSNEMQKEIQQLEDATKLIKQSIQNMSTEASEISKTSTTLSDISLTMNHSIATIENQIDQFQA